MVENLNSLLVKLGNLELNKVKCLQPCAATYEPVCISNGKYRLLADECVKISINCALGDNGKWHENFFSLTKNTLGKIRLNCLFLIL